MLDDLALFIAIVEAGSLNQAARRLDLPTSTLTRRLQRLEQDLGCRLLHRSARRMTPTAEGWQYDERSRPLVHSLQQAMEQLDDSLREVKGLLRVLAPVNLANGVFADAWSGFLSRYPQVRLELQLSNQTQDLHASHADLAIRTGEQPDSQLQQRKLGEVGVRLVASPSISAIMRRRPRPPISMRMTSWWPNRWHSGRSAIVTAANASNSVPPDACVSTIWAWRSMPPARAWAS